MSPQAQAGLAPKTRLPSSLIALDIRVTESVHLAVGDRFATRKVPYFAMALECRTFVDPYATLYLVVGLFLYASRVLHRSVSILVPRPVPAPIDSWIRELLSPTLSNEMEGPLSPYETQLVPALGESDATPPVLGKNAPRGMLQDDWFGIDCMSPTYLRVGPPPSAPQDYRGMHSSAQLIRHISRLWYVVVSPRGRLYPPPWALWPLSRKQLPAAGARIRQFPPLEIGVSAQSLPLAILLGLV